MNVCVITPYKLDVEECGAQVRLIFPLDDLRLRMNQKLHPSFSLSQYWWVGDTTAETITTTFQNIFQKNYY